MDQPDLIDRFLPPEALVPGETRRRGRLVVLTALLAGIWPPIFIFVYAFWGLPGASVSVGIGGLTCLGGLVAAKFLGIDVAGRFMVGGAVVSLGGIAFFTGGAEAPVLSWMILPPMVAAVLFGGAEALIWSVASLVTVFIVWSAGQTGVLPAEQLHSLRLWTISSLMVVVGGVAWFWDKARTTALERERALGAEVTSALEAVEKADKDKTRVLADLAYEVRNPLRSVSGLVDLLLATELREVQREYAENIRESALDIADAMTEIEGLAQVAAGSLSFAESAFDLRQLIEDVAPVEAATAHARGIEIVVSFDPNAPRFVIGVPDRIRQAIRLLSSNAVARATEGGWVQIAARASHISRTHGDFTFEVLDSRDAPDSAHGVFGGGPDDRSGLSIAVARQLIELLGGELDSHFAEGHGSRMAFTLHMPLDHEEHTASMVQPQRYFGRRVLVVDDTPAFRTAVKEELEAWQIRSDLYDDADAALQALQDSVDGDDPYIVAIIDSELDFADGNNLAHVVADMVAAPPVLMLVPFGSLGPQPGDPGLRVAKPVRLSRMPDLLARALAIAKPDPTPIPAPPRPRAIVFDSPHDPTIVRDYLAQEGYVVVNVGSLNDVPDDAAVVIVAIEVEIEAMRKLAHRTDARLIGIGQDAAAITFHEVLPRTPTQLALRDALREDDDEED